MTTEQLRPTEDLNFCRVFELPLKYPEGFLFQGGKPVSMLMVDWFVPWPADVETWPEVEEMLRDFLKPKPYMTPGRSYLLLTDFGKAIVVTSAPAGRVP